MQREHSTNGQRAINGRSQEIAEGAAGYISWIMLLQGISLIVLGVLVLLNPLVVFPIIAFTFLWTGLTTTVMSFRVRRLKKEVPELMATGRA